jgi:hypothetical protein
MGKNTKVNLSMIKEKEKEFSLGKMEESTMENGKVENSMVLEYILAKMALRREVNGIMERRLNGLIDNLDS